jgi:maleylacetate reductase
MIVRWGLEHLPEVLRGRRTFLLATSRWDAPVEVNGRWSDLPTDAPIDPGDTEVLLALGGGSTIDTAKRVSVESGLPLVSVPTTYSGAEWTHFYGVRDRDRRLCGGGGGAHNEAIVYDVSLVRDLPRDVAGGTALNALAHACEALYVLGRDPDADPLALEAAELIAQALPEWDSNRLLQGAAKAGEALARSGLALAHAMAQVIGGAYGLPHGGLNAICLPPALRFNAAFVPSALLDGRAPERADELKVISGFSTLSALGVREDDLPKLAETIVGRPGARANPRQPTAEDVLELLRSVH